MSRPKILVQLDTDRQASVFDAVVAVDAGVDHLLQYARVEPSSVAPLVHGTMFTRGGDDLRNTAIFIGGSDAAAGEALLKAVTGCFFGSVRVSVLLDSNGSNTTAAAAVLTASRHLPLAGARALVLGGTGPVGRRVARLLVNAGAHVLLGSRSLERAREVAVGFGESTTGGVVEPVEAWAGANVVRALESCSILVSAGAAGVQLVTAEALSAASQLRVAIDLNAVPPLGIAGIAATDKAVQRGNRYDYGALGVGGLKMKIHRAAIQQLFTDHKQVLDADQVMELGRAFL